MATYAHPEVLVETDWLAVHLEDPGIRIIESNENPALYAEGHIPNALLLHWKNDLQDPVIREWVTREQFERILGERGISETHTLIFYGDRNNWFATYTFWLFKYYGHRDARILNGGRDKWIKEGRALTTEAPRFPPVEYRAQPANPAIRAFRDELLAKIQQRKVSLVDVRSPEEYRGELLAPPSYPQEGAQRGGHIPGAFNIPWGRNVREDGTFKPADELRQLYESQGVTPDREVVVYCRIGERSSITWFTLTYLLGYPDVRNYDGSWTEWGSLVNVPIER
jgi:thiosulfate/3-mercaptopyruvate sulfurtransferase